MEDLSIYRPSNTLFFHEDMSKYRPGGFHPVCLGDIFNDGRYKIHDKLGRGGLSTVWLIHDEGLKRLLPVIQGLMTFRPSD